VARCWGVAASVSEVPSPNVPVPLDHSNR
jgi:hypothetical protein